jgi:hypothetical protein
MTLPSILLGVVLSTLYGAAFHLLRGGSFGRLILYIVLSWVGFWTGHIFAQLMAWSFVRVGALEAGFATLGSLLTIGAGYWLSLVKIERS